MNHVRDALDGAAGALTDWTVGPDAMRWQPEEDRVEAPRVELVPDGFGGRRTECRRRSAMHAAYDRRRRARRRRNR